MYHLTEPDQIKQIDSKLQNVKSLLEGMLPIFNQLDRKVRSLQNQIHHLELEKAKLSQGQIQFDCEF